ncbi:MAG: hypothetical protein KDE53_24315 [Caldilineaceae bacterium]|nr:hypothetical protein [Caldilineaceae bacterium]MCB0126389.1 hypothetical protein [Caldilineaceae bacterium]
MNSSGISYSRSFILRIRNDQKDAQQKPCWRFVLLDPENDSRRGFASLDQLFAALSIEIGGDTATDRPPSDIIREVEKFLSAKALP